MSTDDPKLDDLRREIDQIDAALHDGIMRRAALMDCVLRAKRADDAPTIPMRTGRETAILRSLAARHEGALPTAVVLRVWREIMNAATALQGPLSIAVCAPAKSVGYWDLARNHFGAATPMSLHVSPNVVLRQVLERPGTVGILPEPQDQEEEPWWLALTSEAPEASALRIIWRLPFFVAPMGRFEELTAYAVARTPPEPTGNDVTILALDTEADISRGRLIEGLAQVGLRARVLLTHEGETPRGRIHLVHVDDFVLEDDPRLVDVVEDIGESLLRALVLGAYPMPLIDAGPTEEAHEA